MRVLKLNQNDKHEKKKNYYYHCIACGNAFEGDELLQVMKCPECGKNDLRVCQQVFQKCPICKKDITPDEEDGDGAYISEKAGIVTIHEILYGYYTDVNSIDVDDWDNTCEYYHKECLENLLKTTKYSLKINEVNKNNANAII